MGLKVEEGLPLVKSAVCEESQVGRDKVSNFVKSEDGGVLRIVSHKEIKPDNCRTCSTRPTNSLKIICTSTSEVLSATIFVTLYKIDYILRVYVKQ